MYFILLGELLNIRQQVKYVHNRSIMKHFKLMKIISILYLLLYHYNFTVKSQ